MESSQSTLERRPRLSAIHSFGRLAGKRGFGFALALR